MTDVIYNKRNLVLAMMLLFGVIMADHVSSETFKYNMGQGGDTVLLKLDEVSGSGCGAP
ncbi:hypothetical protein [Salinibius halmophilus]|uniref:hypothetical protein n=1 Tax=Salinibius halmophilus TaxID=1853216 RepID=UPI0018F4D58D|nr:hypothetical protein [Salinibius halmophilus]